MRAAPAITGLVDTYPLPTQATFQAALTALLNAFKDHGESPELDLASAATMDVGGQNGSRLRITGTTGITSFGTNYRGPVLLRFAAACAITHNASTLICPGNASITTGAGDVFLAYPKATAGVSDGWVLVAQPGTLATTTSFVKGLLGVNNTGTPNTRLDLSADAVTLRAANGSTVSRVVTGTLTCDFALAGPAANGRDQAGAFSASNWIRVFFIWNGTTVASLASLASPTTGPVLPSGYTHWAYATTVYWNGSSNIPLCYLRGRNVHYQAAPSALAAGTAGSATSVSVSTLVPPEALRFALAGTGAHLFVTATAGGAADVTANVGTSATAVPHQLRAAFTGAASAGMVGMISRLELANVGQAFTYNVSASAGSAPSLTLAVADFTVPNGDS